MLPQPSHHTLGHWLLRLALTWPERTLALLLTLTVALVLWSTMHTTDRDGALTLKQSAPAPAPVDLAALREIVVATRLGPTTYLTQPDGRTVGLEHDLALQFGASLGKPVRFLVLDNLEQVLTAVREGHAHFAAAAVPRSATVQDQFSFTPAYQKTRPQIVYNATLGNAPTSVAELAGKTLGVVPSPEHLALLNRLHTRYPGLNWKSFPKGDVDLELMQRVFEGTIQYALSDSNTIAIAQNYYPDLTVAFDLGQEEPVSWAFPRIDQNASSPPDPLYEKACQFLQGLNRTGNLTRMLERYYGHVNALDHEDSSAFLQKIVSRLPHFAPVFKQAQLLSTLDWRLLAAMAYQESRWDKEAISPTGVRGIMMLTADTADRLHVTDRTDPDQAIPAAALYLQQLRDLVPQKIPEPDRTWMALAAYNVGYAHVEDARILARQNHLNPDAWNDVKTMLPLLSTPTIYEHARYGFARGGEPVNFVENVRSYYDILTRFEAPYHQGPIRSRPPI